MYMKNRILMGNIFFFNLFSIHFFKWLQKNNLFCTSITVITVYTTFVTHTLPKTNILNHLHIATKDAMADQHNFIYRDPCP